MARAGIAVVGGLEGVSGGGEGRGGVEGVQRQLDGVAGVVSGQTDSCTRQLEGLEAELRRWQGGR